MTRFSLEVAAAHAGMTTTEVRAAFPDRVRVARSATGGTVDLAISTPLTPLMAEKGTVAFCTHSSRRRPEEPGLVELLAASLVSAADPTVDGADYYRSIYRRFRESVRNGLAEDVRAGREPETMDPVRGAEQLLALYDGLRLQAGAHHRHRLVVAFDRRRRGCVVAGRSSTSTTYWDIPVAGARE